MNANTNRAWDLQDFLDSLILELDRAQDTLAIKGVTRPLTYTVKDIGLDLHAFPTYDGARVRFTTAQPGESGASRLSIELGSITDRVIREVTRGPVSSEDIPLEEVEDLDDETKRSLEKIGVQTASDIERIAERKVDLKAASGGKTDYSDLANVINRTRRRRAAPRILGVGLGHDGDESARLEVRGDHLAGATSADGFPAALLNGEPVAVVTADEQHVVLSAPAGLLRDGANRLELALDPFAVVTLEIRR